MKKLITFFLLCICAQTWAQTSGGPDAFGYMWRTSQDMAAKEALLKIGSFQLQEFTDFTKGAGQVAMNMGSGGKAFLNRILDVGVEDENLMRSRRGEAPRQSFLQRLAEARISPEQFNQMAAMGVQTMGSTFNEEQILAAG